ncbi:MAG: SDR family NAD(P)-dependent oxidoreductase [Myxococcota bacterium]
MLVAPGAEGRLTAVLRWLLSPRSAWMSGQTVSVDLRAASDEEPDEVARTLPLAGETAVVTGAARGIGAAIVKRFAAEGAHVIAVDRPGDEGPLSSSAAPSARAR